MKPILIVRAKLKYLKGKNPQKRTLTTNKHREENGSVIRLNLQPDPSKSKLKCYPIMI